MKVYVGTSGWLYSWNKDGTLDWYLKNSGLNSIELNASFYRFPFPNQVKSWAKKTMKLKKEFRWSIKVNRLITHIYKFDERALSTFKKFLKLFKLLESFIDFYLFQLPPNISPNLSERISKFFKNCGTEKIAIEWRNEKWFKDVWIKWVKNLGITLVSVDAPFYTNLPRKIFCINGIVYLRMHGRTEWYSHYYTKEELKEVKEKIDESRAKKVYIYFNNNHAMLENGRLMKALFEKS